MTLPSGMALAFVVTYFVASAQSAPLGNSFDFPPSAKFERWQHFKDYGVQAVYGRDALNSAAIADGACRMTGKDFDSFFFWHFPARVQRVLQALKEAPSTSKPSNFVLKTTKSLEEACKAQPEDKAVANTSFSIKSTAASLQNWYHALCAPADDPSWKGEYDPAYQPQQVALTSGFMCITACDFAAKSPPAVVSTLDICAVHPWIKGNSVYAGSDDAAKLMQAVNPLLKACRCAQTAVELV